MPSRSTTESSYSEREQLLRALIAAASVVALAWVAGRVFPQADVRLYASYAHRMLHASLAGGLPREYPALAGIAFVLVALLPLAYLPAFMATMATALLALVAAGERLLRRPGWSQRLLLYLALGAAPLMLARYDLLPALCVVIGVGLAMRGRYGGAWTAVAAGAALKLFPALLLPGLFIEEWRRTGVAPWRRVALLACIVAGAAAIQSAVAPGTLLSPVRYEMKRGFEFSSVPGTLTLLVDPLHLTWHPGFGAWQVHGSGQAPIALMMTAAELLLIVSVWVWLYRRRLSFEAASLAVLSVAMLTDRALAPQYLIWVAPLWALWPLRKSWLAASLLSLATYPVAFVLGSTGPGSDTRDLFLATVVGAARNVFLLAGTAAWLRSQLGATAENRVHVGEALSRSVGAPLL